jgi:UDP-2,3-diacylglucosamine hydrolase
VTMSTIFISDLHLNPTHPELISIAIDFLKQLPTDVESLYILGDLFNTWLGDDIVPDEFSGFIEQLKKLSQKGIRLYLMVGNRDFMMGKHFANDIGATLLPEELVIDLYGTPTLIMHGDSLCIDDHAYQRYRKWTRSKFLQWCFLHLSKKKRQAISDKIKQKSKQQKQFKSAMIMDINQGELINTMHHYDVNYIIHGHTHRPSLHHFITNENQTKQRIVLGDWENKISYLRCDEHQFKLVDHRVEPINSIILL